MPSIPEKPRILLELFAEEHFEGYHKLRSSVPSLIWSTRPPRTREENRIVFEECREQSTTYAIVLPASRPGASPETIGLIGLVGCEVDGMDEIGYMLHVDHWRKGYMSEALQTYIGPKGIFWELPDNKSRGTIVARVDVENAGSTKVIQSVGARRGETSRKSYALAKDMGPDGLVPEEKLRDAVTWYIDRPAQHSPS